MYIEEYLLEEKRSI